MNDDESRYDDEHEEVQDTQEEGEEEEEEDMTKLFTVRADYNEQGQHVLLLLLHRDRTDADVAAIGYADERKQVVDAFIHQMYAELDGAELPGEAEDYVYTPAWATVEEDSIANEQEFQNRAATLEEATRDVGLMSGLMSGEQRQLTHMPT